MAPDVCCCCCYDLLTKMKDSKLGREEQKNLQKPGEGKRQDKTRSKVYGFSIARKSTISFERNCGTGCYATAVAAMYVFSREETGAITTLILIAEKGLVEFSAN